MHEQWDKEAKKFDSFRESKEVNFKRCKHKKAKVVNNELRCPCGSAWSGPRLNELVKALVEN